MCCISNITHLLRELDKVGSVASRSRFEPCVRDEDDEEEFEESASRIILMTALDVSPEHSASGQVAEALEERMRRR